MADARRFVINKFFTTPKIGQNEWDNGKAKELLYDHGEYVGLIQAAVKI